MASKQRQKRVLVVGLICLDIINTVDKYPSEDEDKRTLSHRWQRGGNAANQSYILSQLGSDVEFFGNVATGEGAEFALNTLRQQGVACDHVIVNKGCRIPTSYVTCSLETGSRTIVHNRGGMPELSAEYFKCLCLDEYDWVHFETRRNIKDIHEMLDMVDAYNKTKPSAEKITVSIEIEKPINDGRDGLIRRADVIFISKDYARFIGYNSPTDAINGLISRVRPGGCLISPWGDAGAQAMGTDRVLVDVKATNPGIVVDTLGAGDTFVAGVVQGLRDGVGLRGAVRLGCMLAGYKCGIEGYNGLGDRWRKIVPVADVGPLQEWGY
ncbi:ketohexokinase [Nematostella vectensis]|uniref:ketohexokinase n=1 Tax=Nematostella vectensis TaxID=45351 RepID=UPI0013905F6A|nr:ketohexokinase [Nematostella vectensis]